MEEDSCILGVIILVLVLGLYFFDYRPTTNRVEKAFLEYQVEGIIDSSVSLDELSRDQKIAIVKRIQSSKKKEAEEAFYKKYILQEANQ